MSTAAALAALTALAPLAEKMMEWAKEGLSNDEIRKRLADPAHVGDDMIDRVAQREERGRGLLGRDPKPRG